MKPVLIPVYQLIQATTARTVLTGGRTPASVLVDINKDGKPDLVIANDNSSNVSVLLNGLMFAPTLTAAPATTATD